MSDLPLSWSSAPLAEIVDVLDSMRVPINASERERRLVDKRRSDLVPYYGATGQVGFIDEAIFNENLVLLGEDGVPFFDRLRHKAYRINGPSWVNNHAHVLRPKPEVTDERYVEAYLNAFDYTGYVSGSTRLKLTQGAMNSIPVLLAPLPEQKRIADKLEAVLGRVDACRARLARVPDLLKRFRQSVLAAATSGRLTEDWRSESHNETPWKGVTVEQVARSVFDGPFGSNLKTADYTDSGVRVVRLENIGWMTFAEEKESFVSKEKYETLRRHTLIEGDVMFSSFIADETRVALLPKSWSRDSINKSDCFCIRTYDELCIPKFLVLILACRSTYKELSEGIHGATRPRINLRQLKSFEFSLPSIPEQQEIVRRVAALFAFADRIESGLHDAQTTVDHLTPSTLAKAFRGELVPQDPNDEPASTLLARIRAERATAPTTRKRRSTPVTKRPRAPKEKAAMTKSRYDDDVKGQPYLANLLKNSNARQSAEELFQKSELPLVDFYKQLAWEVENGKIRDDANQLEAI